MESEGQWRSRGMLQSVMGAANPHDGVPSAL